MMKTHCKTCQAETNHMEDITGHMICMPCTEREEMDAAHRAPWCWVCRCKGHEAELTTEHPTSSYGQPVLVHDGIAYGPGDRLPDGRNARRAVEAAGANWTAEQVSL